MLVGAARGPSSATVVAEDSSSSLRSDPPVERPAVKAPARAKRVAIVSQTVSATCVHRSSGLGPLRLSWRYVSLGSRHNRTVPVLSFSRQPQLRVLLVRAGFFRALEVDERSTCDPSSVPAGPAGPVLAPPGWGLVGTEALRATRGRLSANWDHIVQSWLSVAVARVGRGRSLSVASRDITCTATSKSTCDRRLVQVLSVCSRQKA